MMLLPYLKNIWTFSKELSYEDFLRFAENGEDNNNMIKKMTIKRIKEDLSLLKMPKSSKPSINEIENEDDNDEDLVETLVNERRFDYGNIFGGNTGHDISDMIFKKRDFKEAQDIFDIGENNRIYYYRYLLDRKIGHSLKTIRDYAKR
ncbi:hypothetical protein ACTA71_006892 [Dictyostelium dimigraforme]